MGIKELFLKRFNFVMPMVYDDAISYPELIYKMLNKQNEIIDQVNANSQQIELTNANESAVSYDSTGLYLVRNGKNVVARNSTNIVVSSDVPSGILWCGSPPAYGMQYGIMVENATKSVVTIYADSEGNIRNFGTLPTGNYRIILSYICQ